MDVMQIFQSTRTVVVSCAADDGQEGHPSEIVLSRLTFLQHAITAPSLSVPLSSLINSIATPCLVGTRETLDIVLQSMLGSGFEEVGVTEGGSVTGVLHVDEIFTFLAKELAWAFPEVDTTAAKAHRGEVEEASILAATRYDDVLHRTCLPAPTVSTRGIWISVDLTGSAVLTPRSGRSWSSVAGGECPRCSRSPPPAGQPEASARGDVLLSPPPFRSPDRGPDRR